MLQAEEVRAYLALLSAATLLQRAVDENLRESVGVSHAQFEILARLAAVDEGVRMTDLAKSLILSRSGTTYRVQQLAAAGYVSREPDPQDDRGVIASLTAAGADALAAAVPGHEALVQRLMFDALTCEQLDMLTSSLEAVVHKVDPDFLVNHRPRSRGA